MALTIGMPTHYGMTMELPPEFIKRRWAPMVKAVLFGMPRVWQEMFVPEHFKIIATTKYAYKKRTEKYLRRKRKAKKHDNPLAFSWKTKNQMTSQYPSVTGSAKAVTGLFRVPWYINMRPTKRNAPILGEELTRTTKSEAQKLAVVLRDKFEAELRKAIPLSRKTRSIS